MELLVPFIKLKFKTSENDFIEFHFKRSGNTYESEKGVIIKLDIENNVCKNGIRIDKLPRFEEYNEEIINQIIEKYNQEVEISFEDKENGVDYAPDGDLGITIPYAPESIKISQARFSLKEIYEMIIGEDDIEPTLDLSPDFQRNYVWDRTRKSRLIESILLKIPLPVFYLSRDSEGKYQVVDGVQRLSVINEYFSNGFKLSNLEYLNKDCELKYYHKEPLENSLHPKFVRTLRTYQIDCNIIEPSTPTEVKFDIFKRLNTGGKSLNNQEIRNSIMKKQVRDFIRKLAQSEEFRLATNGKIKSKRMIDQEMILRFLGFYFLYEVKYLDLKYKGNMSNFLDQLVESLNDNHTNLPFDKIESIFYRSMKSAHSLFGVYAFKKISPSYRIEDVKLINKSLFTVLSVLLTRYDQEQIRNTGNITNEFAKYLKETPYLEDSITYGTSDKVRIDTTFLLVEEFLDKFMGDYND
ncbi:DUF262 domain-containing protein [Exiguobacterium profundum]|uniref:DUF262 domain-containing protein n=1 Tax=Exiguobacterium profundum TaxID=307643 RepID=UPI00339875F0